MTFNDNASLDTAQVQGGGSGGNFPGGPVIGGVGGLILLLVGASFGVDLSGGGTSGGSAAGQAGIVYGPDTTNVDGSDEAVEENISRYRTGRDANSDPT